MQICIHRKDNSPKPVNHRLTLKERPKVKSKPKYPPDASGGYNNFTDYEHVFLFSHI